MKVVSIAQVLLLLAMSVACNAQSGKIGEVKAEHRAGGAECECAANISNTNRR